LRQPNTPSSAYRPDIDGLRAVAVLSVMLFHASRVALPGGFVGVDVFFVISGYLITRNIAGELDRARFSLLDFYSRRVRRIAPMMLVVVLVTLIAAALLLVPEDVAQVGKSAVFSLASLANVFFWRYEDHSYFAADSAQSPLLHLWSLGVEEQFYLAWPLLLLLLYRRASAGLFCAGIALAALCSFVLGNLVFGRDASFAYYMMPTRAGELLLGALVAIRSLHRPNLGLPRAVALPCAAVGLLMLGASFWTFSSGMVFPGVAALLPTSGTALLIAAGEIAPNPVSSALSVRPLQLIGLISYSAYLWHWPLLAFYRVGYGTPGVLPAALLLGTALLLASLSYRFIEQPARHYRGSPLRVFAWEYAVPAVATGVLAVALVYPQRFHLPWPLPNYTARLSEVRAAAKPAFDSEFICQRQRLTAADLEDTHCVLGAPTDAPTNVIVWGDSNASHYVGLIDVLAQRAGFRFRNAEIGSCPPLHADPAPYVEARRLADCRASLLVAWPQLQRYDVIIMSAAWSEYERHGAGFLANEFATVRELTHAGKLVVLLGKVPMMPGYDRLCAEKALSFPFLACPAITAPLAADIASVNRALRTFAEQTAGVRYFDATALLCSHDMCSQLDPDGRNQYFDAGHLTIAASTRLGVRLLHDAGVPEAFAAAAARANATPTAAR
jgi:peptidoglycan/LPS O-acetylase OafA/YrhL